MGPSRYTGAFGAMKAIHNDAIFTIIYFNMISETCKTCLFSFLLMCLAQFAIAQNAPITDSLFKANATALSIKGSGTQVFGKIPKFSFGDYAVVSGKVGATNSSASENILLTSGERKSYQKFSFIFTGNAGDSVKVDAFWKFTSQSHNGMQIARNVFVGRPAAQEAAFEFVAGMTLSSDTSQKWTLVIKNEEGTDAKGKHESYLTDGKRNIQIISMTNSQNTPMFAGLDNGFVENNQLYTAFQYWGNVAFTKKYQNMIWLDKGIDPKMKILLSAATTAIIELRVLQHP